MAQGRPTQFGHMPSAFRIATITVGAVELVLLSNERRSVMSWLVKALHVLFSTGVAVLCIAMGVYLLVDPIADRLLASRGLGLFGVGVGLYWLLLMKRAL